MEIWKDIKGYEGLYQVSNEGRVKSLNFRRKGVEKVLKPRKVTKGYLQVALWKNRKRKDQMVHRLVGEAFIPNPDNLPQINHKNEDKTLNTVENLEWCTNEYNHNYGTRNIRAGVGLNKNSSKIVYQYTLDGELVKVFPSTMECGRNGYKQGSVAACCRGKYGCKTHKGYRWSYIPL